MKIRHLIVLFFILLGTTSVHAAKGRITGEEAYELPSWFKSSFLEIQEDVLEANGSNKHIMLFMHIDRCPYCTKMLSENFSKGKNKSFIQKKFDVIALNIKGDREIMWDEKTHFTEKSLAKILKVMATPAIIFLNEKGKKIFQMNGYRKPSEFRKILNYVNEKKYTKLKLLDYLALHKESNYKFKSHPQFVSMTDFSKYSGPMVVLFEDKDCIECNEFHQEVLRHKDVMHELKALKVIRLDADSIKPIVDNKGRKTTAKNWAKALNLDYRPSTIIFDKGKEVTRLEGRLYHFHYKELLRFVSGGFYQKQPIFTKYLDVRVKALLAAGFDVDVSE